jgi:dimeric dUTPase (all-alpha-NTP-PPase superfamily)
MSKDMLYKIFEKQKQLQRNLNTYPEEFDEQYIKDHIFAAIVELTEILNETPWKPWKKQQELNSQRYKEEIADLLHFVINLCIVARIEPEQLYDLYMDKNKVNIERKQRGY